MLPYKRAALVATRRPDCGQVRVVIAAKPNNNSQDDIAFQKTIDLRADTVRKRRVIPIVAFSSNAGQAKRQFIFVTRAEGNNGTPRIEGIGISAY